MTMTQPSAGEVLIREFQPGDEAAFRDLNEEWITRYFRIEAKDREAFDNPQGKILKAGGRIFFAILNGQCVGCCALLRIGEDEYEVAKMAVTSKVQGAGIGRRFLTRGLARASLLKTGTPRETLPKFLLATRLIGPFYTGVLKESHWHRTSCMETCLSISL